MIRHFSRIPTLLLTLLVAASARSEPMRIAASSSVQGPVREIARAFSEVHGDCTVQVIAGSSGKLTAQILNGAPFDVFLSADTEYPRRLLDEGAADGPLVVYATGSLVLWSPSVEEPGLSESEGRIARLAVANPRVAPYGRAAMQALESRGVMNRFADRLVYGENVSQAAHFARSGAADAALVASSVLDASFPGSRVAVRDGYEPVRHGLVTLRSGDDCAVRFAAFMRTETAASILRQHGLDVPHVTETTVPP